MVASGPEALYFAPLMIARFLVLILSAYRHVLSPCLHWLAGPGAGCRFEPSCSAYCIEALTAHGAVKGLSLGVRRVCRCHPWGGFGYDPVPPAAPGMICAPATRTSGPEKLNQAQLF